MRADLWLPRHTSSADLARPTTIAEIDLGRDLGREAERMTRGVDQRIQCGRGTIAA